MARRVAWRGLAVDARPRALPLLRAAAAAPGTPPPWPAASRRWLAASAASSVNPAEIERFDALASAWWDPRGPSRLLHLMNAPRHRFVRRCRASSAPSSSSSPSPAPLAYLDVGCGGGIFAESAARLPATDRVVGLDPSPDVLAVARAHAARDPALVSSGRLAYVDGSIESFCSTTTTGGERQQQFDVVSLFEVVEHVRAPADFLRRCGDHVRPATGWLVLSTIARTWSSWLTTKLVAEDLLRLVPPGTHDWSKFVRAAELADFFAADGRWSAPVVQGVVYVPGFGWKEFDGGEQWGNYFFGVRRLV